MDLQYQLLQGHAHHLWRLNRQHPLRWASACVHACAPVRRVLNRPTCPILHDPKDDFRVAWRMEAGGCVRRRLLDSSLMGVTGGSKPFTWNLRRRSSKRCRVYSPKQRPARTRPARPLRCSALARLTQSSTSRLMPRPAS
jgi:hypothetical protein